MKKTVYLIWAIFIIISAFGLQSCGDDESGREAFSPESGAYKIMLNPEEWEIITLSSDQSPNQLVLFSSTGEFIIMADCYGKTGLSDVGVSDIDGFPEFYKTFENGKNIYENPESISTIVGDLTEIAKKEIKNSAATAGKRQTVKLTSDGGAEVLNEVIYLESENHFFAVSYGTFPEKFDDIQKSVNDVIAHIKTD